MSQIGRQLEAPRPLKSSLRTQMSAPAPTLPFSQHHQAFEVNTIEDLIALIETVAQSLAQGDVSIDLFNKMFTHVSSFGHQLEVYSKEILDRSFIVFRNASQDDRLKISVRLNLLNLIELRANSWQISDGLNTYYKQKAASNVEPESDLSMLATSPSMSNLGLGISNLGQTLLPGEIVKNSGKFAKPTKIPGKNYSKDEIIIRNADSGKVMGIKGRRVHIIEEMSNCVISFQRVNPGAKERLVQITGPNEESINYAKLLIEDTIKRNASPIREASQEGSCSSLASSDDQPQGIQRTRSGIMISQSQGFQMPMPSKLQRSGSQHNNLYQNLTSDVLSVEEFKYTVNIGNQCLKITGDSLDLVKIAKLVPDDYFTNEEFQKSDALLMSTDTSVIPSAHPSPFIDSGVHVDLLSRSASNVLPPRQSSQEPIGDVIDIFAADEKLINVSDIPFFKSASIDSTSSSTTLTLTDDNPLATNGLNRSRRSHFSRKDSTPEAPMKTTKIENEQRIIHTSKSLWWFYSNLPLCKALPQNIEYIRDKVPGIVCEKNSSAEISADVLKYSDVEKFLEKREIVPSDEIIEVIDDDD